MNKEIYLKKIDFVKDLNEAITKVQPNVAKIHYDVFINEEEIALEYLIVEYTGGAKTARNCSGNSCSAIFEELSHYLNSGYYSEVDYYQSICEDKNYQLLK